MSTGQWYWVALLPFAAAACGAPVLAGGKGRPEIEVPPYVASYSTDAGSNGVAGGGAASDVADFVEERLEARGDEAEPDGALAATAAWMLQNAYAERNVMDSKLIGGTAQRFGFAGIILGAALVSMDLQKARAALAQAIAEVPANRVITRYGIMGGAGQDVALVLGMVEVSLDDFPRSLELGAKLRLVGNVSERYQRASVFAKTPKGTVRELPMAGREVDARVDFPTRGVYMVEVMGYGATGPVVLLNVPIEVGAEGGGEAAPGEPAEADPNLTAEEAEATIFNLLNDARREAGLSAVALDAELRELALGHSVDMAENDFFGHVSPTTGSHEDRLRKAGLRVSKGGECVAADVTPYGAHSGLLLSPAHRAGMLDPAFTHVGVGVTFRQGTAGQRTLFVTLFLGRRAAPEEAQQTAASVFDAIQGYRKAGKLSSLRVDPVLNAVAAAGIRAFQRSASTTPRQAISASQAELQAQVNRSGRGREVCQSFIDIIEPYQLSQMPILLRPELGSLGVGVLELEDAKGPRLGVLLVMEGARGKALKCE